MVRVLIAVLTVACATPLIAAADGRHQWTVDVAVGLSSSSSDFGSFTDGNLGKLRFADGTGFGATRLFAEYRGRLAPTLWARVSADYVDDASPGVDVTEAYLEWRPIPHSPLRQRWRLGAFHPPLSLENGERGWRSPYTLSFSAINSWLGEEIRPFGLEWSFRRSLGPRGSPHELGAFAGAFYGNDPAGTLLFWRGFALHDRQSRLGDELPLAPAPVFDQGVIVGHRSQSFEPFAEIDHRPGYYGGVEWRYARRALLKLAMYDNRADPFAFSGGQWGWNTRFAVLAAQFELSDSVGLVTEWMSGDTRWLIATTTSGMMTPAAELVHDEFDAVFVLLTKSLGGTHRLTLRYDDFRYSRTPEETFDSGHAWTIGYRYDTGDRLTLSLEGVLIDSERDLWTDFYAAPHRMIERQLRLELAIRLTP